MSSKINTDSIEFARYHSLMMLTLLVFFGILIIPFDLKKIKQANYTEVNATVKHVYYSQPDLSYIQIEVEIDEKKFKFKELVAQKIQKNDMIVVYINGNKDTLLLQRPNTYIYMFLLIAYIIIIIFSIYTIYDLWFQRKSG